MGNPESDMHRKQHLILVFAGFLALFGLVLAPIILKPLLISTLSGLIVAVLFSVVRSNRSNRARRSAWKKASALISNNLDELTQRRTQLVCQDADGTPLFDKWTKEMEHFIDNHISPVLAPQQHRHLPSQKQQLVDLIGQLTYLRMQEEPVCKAFSDMRSTGVLILLRGVDATCRSFRNLR